MSNTSGWACLVVSYLSFFEMLWEGCKGIASFPLWFTVISLVGVPAFVGLTQGSGL